MGAFYGSIHIRTENSKVVQEAAEVVAKKTGCKFLQGPPLNGWISVFPENSGQSDETLVKIANILADDIFHLIVHDDDIFSYFFYRKGRLVDQYNSCPDYFGEVPAEEKEQLRGHPEFFSDLLSDPGSLTKLKTLLAGDNITFEQDRMEQFVRLMSLANALSSYEYLQQGEREGIKCWKQFVQIPDPTPEKAAKRAAKAKLVAEKKRLQKEGLLLAEIKPPGKNAGGLLRSIAWGIDSTTNGLLSLGQSYHFDQSCEDPKHAAEIFIAQPPWNSPLQPTGLKTRWWAMFFCTSPSGHWLAGGSSSGDWKMRVWDWQRKEFAFEISAQLHLEWCQC